MKRLGFIMCFAVLLYAPTASATSSSESSYTQSQDQNYPPPYTGGASVAKYFHLSDGSTMTITSTGAVIKQSPGHNPYRQGWIDTNDICSISSSSDLVGKIKPGSTNPYGNAKVDVNCNPVPTTSPQSTDFNSNSTSTHSSNNSASSSATVITAGSQTTVQTPEKPTATTHQETSAPASNVTSLPVTGPGAAMSVFGVSTILGTAAHMLIRRFR